jgi:two-component system response regulator
MTTASRSTGLRILLIEDNPGDADLVAVALDESGRRSLLHVCPDGEEALAYLSLRSENGALPDLVLLDLRMPGLSGGEVLAAMKADRELRSIPVVVLSTSSAPDDIAHAYRAEANAFVTKPLDLDGFLHAIQAVELFWLRIHRGVANC